MKKIGKKIILFFDKWLITPITKLLLFITDFVKNNGGTITTMIRFEVGEGMQKREENFADEVAKQMQGN